MLITSITFIRFSRFFVFVHRSLRLAWHGIWEICMRFLFNCSSMNWHLVLMYLVLYVDAARLAIVTAEVLSDLSDVGGNTKWSFRLCWWHTSQNRQRIHDISFAYCTSATYSDSADECVARAWRFDFMKLALHWYSIHIQLWICSCRCSPPNLRLPLLLVIMEWVLLTSYSPVQSTKLLKCIEEFFLLVSYVDELVLASP